MGAMSGPPLAFFSPLVGRRDALARLRARLDGGVRLVTLVGPGGIGKTRLARELLAERPAGVFCDLAPATTAAEVAAAVARALDVQGGDGDLVARVAAALRGREAPLVVLDNCEQVIASAAETVGAWLSAAPSARFVATSRQPLGLPAEAVEPVEPLQAEEAARLFRARAPVPVPDAALPRVEAVVGHLEGLPLAIELAAARLSVLSLEALDERLRDRFRVLRDPTAPADARHGTLWRAIDWSWQLLNEAEQRGLACCAVFAGEFDLEAAEAVLPEEPPAMDVIQSLVHKSLVRLIPGKAPRFGLFDSVRAYAAERLEASRRDVEARHAAWYLARGETWASGAYGPGGPACLDALEGAREELRAVGRRAPDAETALRAALALSPLLSTRDSPVAHAEALGAAIARGEAPAGLLARAHMEHGRALRHMGRVPEGEAAMRRAVALAQAAGDARAEAAATAQLANLLIMASRPDDAHAEAERARALASEAGEGRAECLAMAALALLALNAGRLDEAQRWCEAELERLRDVGDARLIGITLMFLADVHQDRGELDQARAVLERAQAVCVAAGLRALEATARATLGNVHHLQGRLDEARAAYGAMRAVVAAHGEPRLECFQRLYTGILDAEQGALDDAERALGEAARLNAITGEARYGGLIDAALAAVLALRGRRSEAEAALADAATALERAADAALARVLEVPRGLLDLAVGANAEARARLAIVTDVPSFDVRLLGRLLSAGLERAEADARAWRVARDGRRFVPPGADPVSLEHRAPLVLLLAALIERRATQPGVGMRVPELALAGWPGERLLPEAAANRVHVALSTLRRLGLAPLIRRDGGAYRLDPSVPLQVED
jgi:predicted ATPase